MGSTDNYRRLNSIKKSIYSKLNPKLEIKIAGALIKSVSHSGFLRFMLGFLNFTKPSRWVMVGYGRFLMVLRGFFVDFLWVFAKFVWVRKTTCGYFFHKPTHGFASFPTQILMKTHTKTQVGFVSHSLCLRHVASLPRRFVIWLPS